MKKNQTTHFMAGILIITFVAVFLVLTGRFLYIQASGEINDVSLEEWANKKRTASYSLEAERGNILDNNGMALAYDRPTFSIYAITDELYSENLEEPKHVENPQKTAEALSPLLNMEKSEIVTYIQNGIDNEKFQVEFGSNGTELSQKTKEDIEDLDLPGINFTKDAIRYYPNGTFASHILGFARKDDEGNITGVNGIENEMNDLLGGKNGHISYQRDNYNTKLLDPNEVIQQPEDGKDVHLTIDQKVQTLLEDAMSQVDEEFNPERITAVIMNPKTGEVVAMGNRPSYNPNDPSNVENWYNDAISTPFEPGSTIKMFTWAAAIEENVYKEDEWFESGEYSISDNIRPVHDHNNGEGWGPITYDEGFERSSNVAASKLVWEKLGTEKYLEYLQAFDLDKKTDIDLPSEVAGQISYNYPRDKITTAFGQGSTLTPIQQMKAATAIANGGKMVQPYVVSKIVDGNTGKVEMEKSPEVVGEPISDSTAAQVMDLLESVVTSGNGTGNRYQLDDYSVAGKTGTAQVPNPDGGGYLTGAENYVFSFLGMAPKDDPRLMMYVSVKQPELDDYQAGSVPVSFIFKNVMENSLHYLNIEPDKDSTNPVKSIELPKIIGTNTSSTKQSLEEKGLNITVIGSGNKVLDANAKEGSQLFPNDRIILVTDQPVMPDITGWSMREVLQLANLLELDIEIIGNGYVMTQSIKEGSSVKKDSYLGVELKPPNEPTTEEITPDTNNREDASDENN
ncbi:penicillin-binding protein [Virgibacillus byunsanensis]|uniref:serine-type D-Ala-D-Ala carboxypeptidase n=1 Tax=Virgibacillus byunsanensis TaxID=570945 RepID=A0ABW3LJU5_9BACI